MKKIIYRLFFLLSISLLIQGCAHDQIPSESSYMEDKNGKKYKTVQIGSQVWMAENLAYKADSGCWAYDDKPINVSTYGYFYTWETAKNVCPSGWHLPTDSEWTIMTNFLGGENSAGGKLKEKGTAHWKSPNTGATNSSGFTGLPGGVRYCDGGPSCYMGDLGYWWSSSEGSPGYGWFRSLFCSNDAIFRYFFHKPGGMFVRCVKN